MDEELVHVALRKADEVITIRIVVCECPQRDPSPQTCGTPRLRSGLAPRLRPGLAPRLRSGLAERRFAEALEGAR